MVYDAGRTVYMVGQNQSVQNFFGGTTGLVGGGYGIWEYMQLNKLENAWDNIVDTWETTKSTINEYVNSINALLVKFEYAYTNGLPLDESEISDDMAYIASLEATIQSLFNALSDLIPKAKDDQTDGLGGMLWAGIEGICKGIHPQFWTFKYGAIGLFSYLIFKKTTGVGAVKAGQGIYKMWEKIRDYFNDKNHPGGTSVDCDICGETINAPDSELLKIEFERHLTVNHVVNVSAAIAAVPQMVYQIAQLPDWVQKSLALEAGIRPQYVLAQNEWATSFQADWRTVVTVVGICAITVVTGYVGAAWLGEMGQVGGVLVPAIG